MANPAGESNAEVLRLDFNHRLMLQFREPVIPSDAGLLAYRELDAALPRWPAIYSPTGKNGRHALVGMLRQAVFGRLAGYEDVNDAEWRQGGFGGSGIAEPNVPLRDALADGAKEPFGACRSFRPMERYRPALAYNLGNFLRTLAMPEPIKGWSLTT
jgi:hypothetical protein